PHRNGTTELWPYKMTYTQQKRADGQGGGQVVGGWDGISNKVYA
ncbi:hypothetical protein PLA106_28748, partial [Pseudomonas amygdali pv. lachrymans str. M302278]